MTHPTLAPEPDINADATFRNWMRLNLARRVSPRDQHIPCDQHAFAAHRDARVLAADHRPEARTASRRCPDGCGDQALG